MNCYAVIDTNVLVSALLSRHDDAATVLVIERMLNREVIPVYSNMTMDEYLVTGNVKHFPTEPFIVTAREFLEILDKRAK